MKKNKLLRIITVFSIIALLTVSGIIAYLIDFDEKENVFTFGKVDVELEEPNFSTYVDDEFGEEVADIMQGQEISKDPQVRNVGNTNSYIYMQVYVPVFIKEISRFDDLDGSQTQVDIIKAGLNRLSNLYELYETDSDRASEIEQSWFPDNLGYHYIKANEGMTSDIYGINGIGRYAGFRYFDCSYYTSGIDLSDYAFEPFSYEINDGWTEIVDARTTVGDIQLTSDSSAILEQFNVYTYYYENELKPGETTPALFDKIKLKSCPRIGNSFGIETDEETEVSALVCHYMYSYQEVGVCTYAIQSELLGEGENITNNEVINRIKNVAIGNNVFALPPEGLVD